MHTDLVTFVFVCLCLVLFSLCVIEGGMHMVLGKKKKDAC